jgi:ribosomal protein S18 acetylase RimI-like enzyme
MSQPEPAHFMGAGRWLGARPLGKMSECTAMMKIRLASADDRCAIEECVAEAYQGYIKRIGKRPASMDREFLPLINAGCVQVCESDGIVLGVMVVSEHAGHVEVSSVAVKPVAQRKGIGRNLMKAAEAIAAERGYRILRVYTNAALPELVHYYERMGYQRMERRVEEGYDRVFLQKTLP